MIGHSGLYLDIFFAVNPDSVNATMAATLNFVAISATDIQIASEGSSDAVLTAFLCNEA